MRWSKRSFMGFLLVLFLLVLVGTLSAETTSSKLDQISTQLTEISKKYNEISVNSEMTLIDLQEISQQLQQELNQLAKDLDQAMTDLAKVMVLSENNLIRWDNLKTGISRVSSSVETLGMSLSILDDSVKKAEKKSNLGLGLSIVAVIVGAIALGYSLTKK